MTLDFVGSLWLVGPLRSESREAELSTSEEISVK